MSQEYIIAQLAGADETIKSLRAHNAELAAQLLERNHATLRDQFAITAPITHLIRGYVGSDRRTKDLAYHARLRYEWADAMLAESRKAQA